jgi:hypothetical protein
MKSLAEVLDGEHKMNPNGQHDGWWECACGQPYDGAHLVAVMEGVATYEEVLEVRTERQRVIDAVAEAIHIADEQVPEPDWATLPAFGRLHYLKLAQAAVETIGELNGSSEAK